MACIRKRRGKYVVDYRDGAGIRRWVTCETRREAETVLLEKAREARQPTRPVVDPNITVSAYAEHWLHEIAVTIKPKTYKSYGQALRLHILPALGSTKVRMLRRGASSRSSSRGSGKARCGRSPKARRRKRCAFHSLATTCESSTRRL